MSPHICAGSTVPSLLNKLITSKILCWLIYFLTFFFLLIQKGVKRKSTEEPKSSAAKQKTKPRVTSPATPRGTPTPKPGPSKAKQIKTVANGPGRGRPATPGSKPVTPQVKSPASRVKSPAMAQSPAARLKSPATAKSPAGRVTSPATRPKKVVKKTQARTQVQPSSPVNGHSSSALNLMSPKGL